MASIKLEQSLKRQYIETSACIDHGFTKSVALAREFNVDPAVICKVLRGVYICG